MKKYDDAFLTELCIQSNIEFISGKFFYKNDEIKNIDKYLGVIYYKHAHKFICQRDLEYMKKGIINNPLADDKEDWPRPSIIDEALERKEQGYMPKKCPFPLDDKQLIILYILLFHPEQEVFFITTGIGGSGKSTFLNIIKQLFDNDVGSTPLGNLGDQFILAEALKHRLIASDELGTGEVNLPVVKTIVSKQYIQVNEKYGATYTTKAQSALFFCCNQAPKIDISDTGMLRRIVYYSRNTKIVNPDPTLKTKKWSKDDLIDFVLCALKVAFIYNENDIDAWKEPFKDETNCYLVTTNSVGLYYKHIHNSTHYVDYPSYREYCASNGYKPFSNQKYTEMLDWIKNNYCDEETLKKATPFQLPDFLGD